MAVARTTDPVGETIGTLAQRRLGRRRADDAPARPGVPMHPLSILLVALAMSTDAFAAAIGKGVAMRKPRLLDALRVGLIFGVIEGVTPIIGWLIGQAAASYVTRWDHWIAFTLLVALGLRMIHAGTRHRAADSLEPPTRHGFWNLALTGFATSIDAMAIGVGLAFIDVSIAVIAIAIGAATTVMVTLGILLGRVLGQVSGKCAEIVGGVILIAVGTGILYQHLGAAGVN